MSNLPSPVQENKLQLLSLWTAKGLVTRSQYAATGFTLFGIKYLLDSAVANLAFHRTWDVWSYIFPGRSLDLVANSSPDRAFFFVLILQSLPFIWIGVVLTIQRLRDARLPTYLVTLFFVPVANMLMFVMLSLMRSQPTAGAVQQITEADEAQPETTAAAEFATVPGSFPPATIAGELCTVPKTPSARNDFAFALAATVPASAVLLWFAIFFLQAYGWGLFIGLPFALGLGSSYLYGRNAVKTLRQCTYISLVALTLLGVCVFTFAWEGAICLLMAAPLGFALTFMGTVLGWRMQKNKVIPAQSATMMLALLLALPALMGAETMAGQVAPCIGVVSSIIIEASPEVTWQRVIAFPNLAPPDDVMFHFGIAYPKGATISGTGAGAVRKCNFSTGAFIEPIKVWDEPRLLKFGVAAQPPSMRELSWVPHEIQPAHLHGYLNVREGQFALTPINIDGKACTKIEGTTWYQNKMWPNTYWRMWSDNIIHKIHMRVLKHIKYYAEADSKQHS